MLHLPRSSRLQQLGFRVQRGPDGRNGFSRGKKMDRSDPEQSRNQHLHSQCSLPLFLMRVAVSGEVRGVLQRQRQAAAPGGNYKVSITGDIVHFP